MSVNGTPLEPQTISIPEAAERLGIGRNQAYEAARTREIRTVKIGKRLLVPTEALDKLLGVSRAAAADEGRQAEREKEPEASSPRGRVGWRSRDASASDLAATVKLHIDATMKDRLRRAGRSLSSEIALRLRHSLDTVTALRVSISVEPA